MGLTKQMINYVSTSLTKTWKLGVIISIHTLTTLNRFSAYAIGTGVHRKGHFARRAARPMLKLKLFFKRNTLYRHTPCSTFPMLPSAVRHTAGGNISHDEASSQLTVNYGPGPELICKAKGLYLLTCKVSRYSLLAWHGTTDVDWSHFIFM